MDYSSDLIAQCVKFRSGIAQQLIQSVIGVRNGKFRIICDAEYRTRDIVI